MSRNGEMLDIQKNYLKFLKVAKDSISSINLSTEQVDAESEKIQNLELLVPVVGSFSAGKSTIINTLMNCQVLPIAVTPETELAAELRFHTEERIEAVKKDGTYTYFSVSDFEQVKQNAQQYDYLRVYLDNEFLKSIHPLVLVDMPGFDSTLEAHNKAILRYIARGTHYIVLVSSEEGTIPQSMLQNLEHMDIADQSISVFMSKSDLRSEGDVNDLLELIQESAGDHWGYDGPVLPISYKNPEKIKEALRTIDPESLFEHVVGDYLKRFSIDITQPLAIKEATLRSDENKGQDVLRKLEDNLERIENERSSTIRKLRLNHSPTLLNRCKYDVEQVLTSSLDLVGHQISVGNSDEVKKQISNDVRNSIVRTLNQELRHISDVAIDNTANTLRDLGNVVDSLGGNSNWQQNTTDSIKDMFGSFSQTLGKLQGGLESILPKDEDGNPKDSKWNSTYRIVASVAAITTNIASPIIELVLVFLPDILKFFGAFNVKEKAIQKFRMEVIPKILLTLDRDLPPIIDEQLENISESINQAFEQKIRETRQAIISANEERLNVKAEIDKELDKLLLAQESIRKAVNQYLFNNYVN